MHLREQQNYPLKVPYVPNGKTQVCLCLYLTLVCLFVCLPVHSCMHPIHLSVCINLFVHAYVYLCWSSCMFVHCYMCSFIHLSICPSVYPYCLSVFPTEQTFLTFLANNPPPPHRNPHPLFIPAVANKYLSKFDTPMSCSQGKIRFAEIFYVHFNPPLLSLWLVILLLLSLLLTSRYVIEMLSNILVC